MVYSAEFSPDGQRVVTGSKDKTARLWDAATGKAIGEPMQHEDEVRSAQFSPDGQRVVTASDDKTARLWDLPTSSIQDRMEDFLLLADLAEASCGVALQTSGQSEILNLIPANQVKAIREKIAARFRAPSSNLTPVQRLLKWSVSDRRNRTISPFSELTVAEWAENRIKARTPYGLRAAIQVYPANARLIAHLGRLLVEYDNLGTSDPAEVERAGAEADFQTRRALELAPDNNEVKRLRVEAVTHAKISLGLALTEQARQTESAQAKELLSQAVATYRGALEVTSREQLPQDWARTQNNLASALGDLAFRLVLDSQFAEAQARCEEAQRLANEIGYGGTDRDKLIFIQQNLAHALLFQGHYDEALAIYRQYWDKPLNGKTFGEITSEDFAAFDKAGLTHPDLSRMKQALENLRSKGPSP
jgi:tetratricopeptide (TPR) repeat protein